MSYSGPLSAGLDTTLIKLHQGEKFKKLSGRWSISKHLEDDKSSIGCLFLHTIRHFQMKL